MKSFAAEVLSVWRELPKEERRRRLRQYRDMWPHDLGGKDFIALVLFSERFCQELSEIHSTHKKDGAGKQKAVRRQGRNE